MKQEDQGQCSSQSINNFHTYQDQLLLLQQQHQHMMNQRSGLLNDHNMFQSDVSPILQPWSLPQAQPCFNPVVTRDHDPFFVPPQQSSSPYASFFNRRVVPSLLHHHHHQFAYEGSSSTTTTTPCSEQLRILSETLNGSAVVAPYGIQAELGKMSVEEIMEAKALAQSKSHSEAERRRRERINNHLAKLRTLLPSTTKTDKASLLAEVIQHVKELKRQTSLIAETSPVPTEADELTVDTADEDGKFVIKASLCCEDRSDLLPELIKALKELRLRTFKAEITTLGGRVKNVLFITGDEDSAGSYDEEKNSCYQQHYCISSIQEALKAVMEKCVGDEAASASGSVKRQRTNTISI